MFMPSYVGVRGNEHADRLARLAPIIAGKAVDLVDFFKAVQDRCWREGLRDNEE